MLSHIILNACHFLCLGTYFTVALMCILNDLRCKAMPLGIKLILITLQFKVSKLKPLTSGKTILKHKQASSLKKFREEKKYKHINEMYIKLEHRGGSLKHKVQQPKAYVKGLQ